MHMKSIKIALSAIVVVPLATGARAGAPCAQSISLTQAPLVMRLSKDEFRIAFGIHAGRTAANGCIGVIRYSVEWRTEDGTTRSETRRVNYTVLPRTSRSITVDRQYFDTGEGQHTTEVVRVSVDRISCLDAGDPHPQLASAATEVR
jgi:hypothetical protein